MVQPDSSRRGFLAASANLASMAWLSMNWTQVAAAAEQAGHAAHGMHHAAMDKTPAPTTFTTLSATEAADVEAIANQIVPGGSTPGARQARVVYFIDRALGSFFADQLPAFRQGLSEFQKGHAARPAAAATFAAAPDAEQIAWLKDREKTPFFIAVRRLTVLGLLALPKYGGNHELQGWKVIGVVDQHVWKPPFGHYDIGYAGFEPYPGTKPYTA